MEELILECISIGLKAFVGWFIIALFLSVFAAILRAIVGDDFADSIKKDAKR